MQYGALAAANMYVVQTLCLFPAVPPSRNGAEGGRRAKDINTTFRFHPSLDDPSETILQAQTHGIAAMYVS